MSAYRGSRTTPDRVARCWRSGSSRGSRSRRFHPRHHLQWRRWRDAGGSPSPRLRRRLRHPDRPRAFPGGSVGVGLGSSGGVRAGTGRDRAGRSDPARQRRSRPHGRAADARAAHHRVHARRQPARRPAAPGRVRAQRSDWGPISAEGFAWYPVIRLGELTALPPLSEGPLVTTSGAGWVAAGDAAEAFIQLLDPRCAPRPVSLATLEAMQPWEQLACFGPEQITLEGTFGCSGCAASAPGTFEPGWLAHPMNFDFLSVDPNARIGPFAMRFAPDGPPPPAVGADHSRRRPLRRPGGRSAARSRRASRPRRSIRWQPGSTVASSSWSRSFEVTGTDPDFPSGPPIRRVLSVSVARATSRRSR